MTTAEAVAVATGAVVCGVGTSGEGGAWTWDGSREMWRMEYGGWHHTWHDRWELPDELEVLELPRQLQTTESGA